MLNCFTGRTLFLSDSLVVTSCCARDVFGSFPAKIKTGFVTHRAKRNSPSTRIFHMVTLWRSMIAAPVLELNSSDVRYVGNQMRRFRRRADRHLALMLDHAQG